MGEGIGTPSAIRLLILGSSQDQTGSIEASLRNAGIVVHCDQIFDMDALEDRLRSEIFDILVCYAFDQNIDITRALATIDAVQQDLPLILIFAQYTKDLLQFMRKGVKDVVEKDNLEHLQLVIIREIIALQYRRELEILKQQLQASNQRCLDLVEGSREAIAFFQDGMHVHVNPAYLQMFGFKSQADVEALPLLDIVDKSHHKNLRAALKTLDTNAENSISLDVTGQHKDGTSLNLVISIGKVELEGEPSLQMTVRNRTPITAPVIDVANTIVKEAEPKPQPQPQPKVVKLDQPPKEPGIEPPKLKPVTAAAPIAVASTPVVEKSKEDTRLLALLERGLTHNRFRLLYNSIVNLHGGGIKENYTVTARLMDENNQDIPQKVLIDLAKKYDKMGKIDRWLIRNAIAALSMHRQEQRKIGLFIELSEASLLDKNLLLWIVECLREYDARGGWLTFQIDEKYAKDNIQVVAKQVEGLKTIKCQIALDQFGLLPNPESLLNQLDVHYVKLAPSLVQGLFINQQKQDELRLLNDILQRHNIKTVATAVEDGNSLSILWNFGIACVQGQFPQEPSPDIEVSL